MSCVAQPPGNVQLTGGLPWWLTWWHEEKKASSQADRQTSAGSSTAPPRMKLFVDTSTRSPAPPGDSFSAKSLSLSSDDWLETYTSGFAFARSLAAKPSQRGASMWLHQKSVKIYTSDWRTIQPPAASAAASTAASAASRSPRA
jgi:hypothetical protein